ncbi:MAG: murein L,D-transpeptidase catalytic domain family protein [Cytophagaceae bacterium]
MKPRFFLLILLLAALPLFNFIDRTHSVETGVVTNPNNLNPEEEGLADSKTILVDYLQELYHTSGADIQGLKYDVLKKAITGFYNIKKEHKINKNILTVIDYSLPSIKERLWIIDLDNKKVLFHSLVAHGKNSGENLAVNFSNSTNSHMSSLGFYRTKGIYFGKHGKSLIIEGLDKEYNANAEARYVVVHGADYVSKEFVDCNGRLGRSHGCPAIPKDLTEAIISTIKDGTVMFSYHPKYKSQHYMDENAASDAIGRK